MEQRNGKSKLLKILLIVILSILLISIVVTVGIGNYFVNYAILRSGDGGDRKVQNEDTVEVGSMDDESEKIINENRQVEQKLVEKWIQDTNNKKVEIKAKDGITLRGNQYLTKESSNKWAIILHGYRSEPDSVISIGMHFSEKGYNVLIPSMRACSNSDGEYIGMGWLDKEDLQGWINLIIEQNKEAEIILHGSSMGAATVLMVSGDNLPTNVKAIIADSGYTSVWDIFASEAKARFNLPSFPILDMFRMVANRRAGYDIKEASALEQVKNSKTPILLIHGDADDFVPEYMCEELYEAANCKKEKLIIHNAGHTESRYKEPDTYYHKIFDFINNQ